MVSFVGKKAEDRTIRYVSELVKIPSDSQNPDSEIYNEIERIQRVEGLAPIRIGPHGYEQWQNVVGISVSSDCTYSKTTKVIAFLAHSDTVEIGDENSWDDDPLSGKITRTEVEGRGSTDCIPAIAAQAVGIGEFRRDNPDGDYIALSVVWPAEEIGGTIDGQQVGYLYAFNYMFNKVDEKGENPKKLNLNALVVNDVGPIKEPAEGEKWEWGLEGSEKGTRFVKVRIKSDDEKTAIENTISFIRYAHNYQIEGYQDQDDPSLIPTISTGTVNYGKEENITASYPKGKQPFPNKVPAIATIKCSDLETFNKIERTICMADRPKGFKSYIPYPDTQSIIINTETVHNSTPFLEYGYGALNYALDIITQSEVDTKNISGLYAGMGEREGTDCSADIVEIGIDTRIPLGMKTEEMRNALSVIAKETLGVDEIEDMIPSDYWTPVKFHTESPFSKKCNDIMEIIMERKPVNSSVCGATETLQTASAYVDEDNIVGIGTSPIARMHSYNEKQPIDGILVSVNTNYGIMDRFVNGVFDKKGLIAALEERARSNDGQISNDEQAIINVVSGMDESIKGFYVLKAIEQKIKEDDIEQNDEIDLRLLAKQHIGI